MNNKNIKNINMNLILQKNKKSEFSSFKIKNF